VKTSINMLEAGEVTIARSPLLPALKAAR
jgi:hypothetical protein